VHRGVVQDQVLRREQVADHRDVGGVAADEHQRVLRAEEARQLGFQLAVQLALPRRQPLAETDVPNRSIAALAASFTAGWPARPR
jgi:hypothetical protein